MELEALTRAIDMFGVYGYTYHSDCLYAIDRAKKLYKGLDIRHVNGRVNPADPYTH